ncbi:GTPase HflX [Geodia barretti]|uniref:GTPase HflX n=1 Tax=Geodia barretti TaxID=519541 RepID=A0AA35RXJ7_GEOBA|nr:GTPase HflX [Geodia barretti]
MVAVEPKKRGENLWGLEDTLVELEYLARSAGAEVIATVSQRAERITPTYLGKGKLQELKELLEDELPDVVICDDELTPTQQRNLEAALQIKVIDRTALILDVFGRHARTREGQIQWSHLERLGGGIGTRGPGETQLETDRRLIRRRIQKIESELDDVRKRRSHYLERRRRSSTPMATLVGYTNAGKSTLFNALCDAGVPAEDQLFNTLDPVTRRLRLPDGNDLLLSDTVGFIQKLSPTVVAAFRATLEELSEADLLLHVIDITHPKAPEQAEVVEQTLADLDLGGKPRLLVINKMDLLTDDPADVEMFDRIDLSVISGAESPAVGGRVFVSAARGWNLPGLLEAVLDQVGSSVAVSTPATA